MVKVKPIKTSEVPVYERANAGITKEIVELCKRMKKDEAVELTDEKRTGKQIYDNIGSALSAFNLATDKQFTKHLRKGRVFIVRVE